MRNFVLLFSVFLFIGLASPLSGQDQASTWQGFTRDQKEAVLTGFVYGMFVDNLLYTQVLNTLIDRKDGTASSTKEALKRATATIGRYNTAMETSAILGQFVRWAIPTIDAYYEVPKNGNTSFPIAMYEALDNWVNMNEKQ